MERHRFRVQPFQFVVQQHSGNVYLLQHRYCSWCTCRSHASKPEMLHTGFANLQRFGTVVNAEQNGLGMGTEILWLV